MSFCPAVDDWAAMTRKRIKGFCVLLIIAITLYLGITYLMEGEYQGDGTTADSSSGKGGKPDVTVATDVEKPTGQVSIDLPPVAETPITFDTQVDSVEDAQIVLDQTTTSLELGDGSSLEIEGDTVDEQQRRYFQVQQKYKGIEVYGATSVLEVQNNDAEVLYGTTVKGLEVDISPSFGAVEALKIALTNSGVPDNRTIETLNEEPRQIILMTDEGGLLCWVLGAYLTNPDAAPQFFTVDAHQPRIVQQSPMIRQ